MATKPIQLLYGVDDKPPIWISIILAIQHILIMSTSLLFPAIVVAAAGSSLSVADATDLTTSTMIAMALGTFLLQFRGKWIGAGFLCPAICEPAYLAVAIFALMKGGLPLLFGMGLLAGIFEILISFGLRFAKKLIPTEVTGVVVMMIGINLITPDIRSAFNLIHTTSAIPLPVLILFVVTLAIVILLGIWGPKKLPLYSIVITAVLGYVLAFFMGLFPHQSLVQIAKAPIVSIPHFMHFFHFSFQGALLLPFMVAAFSASIKAVGNITTAQKITDMDWVRPGMKSIRNAVFTDGLATVFSSILGGMPMGTSSSNVAYCVPSRCASRWINIVIAIILVILAFVPKISLLLVYMPGPVRSALLAYVICFMIVAGLQIVTSRMLDLRKTLIIGLSLGLGLSVGFLPQMVNHLPHWIQSIFQSPLSTAALTAFILNLVFRIGIKKHVALSLNLDEKNSDKIREFFDDNGKLWAALPSLIKKGQDATLECVQAIMTLGLENKRVELSADYDEYNLKLKFSYEGPSLILPEGLPPLGKEGASSEASRDLALFLMQSNVNEYSCRKEKGNSIVTLIIKS